MEAILLAGGLGTRLHAVTGDKYPKCLAEINHKPFIHYLIDSLSAQGVTRFIFAVSHHAELVKTAINKSYPALDVDFSYENEPLGTGGAIKQALSSVKGTEALIVNADSFMEFNLADFIAFSNKNDANLSIVCIKVADIQRFGAVNAKDNKLIGFLEKGGSGSGYINAGIYLINCEKVSLEDLGTKFSFEKDVLEAGDIDVFTYMTEGLFFDIGTPEDFAGAQNLVALNQRIFGMSNK